MAVAFLDRAILHVHETDFRCAGTTEPSAPGGMAAVYGEMVADQARTDQVIADVVAAATEGRHCLVLTNRVTHVETLAKALAAERLDPVVLLGGMGVKARAAALQRLTPVPGGPSLLVVAIGSYVGEGFDCPALDTLFLVSPIAFKGRLVQYAGRILRPYPGKTTAEVHDYHDVDCSNALVSVASIADKSVVTRRCSRHNRRPAAIRCGPQFAMCPHLGDSLTCSRITRVSR
jgi:superfamily II DNA or RNA helicase